MGLAEPRKRIKLSHDPRNTTWTSSTNSYGQRLMQQQGWKAGEALGAKGRGSKYGDAEAAKVNVKYKDDTLGLGATLKSKDIASQSTGLDAFQGLLGRLNAKTEEEVQVVEKKLEDKKLAIFAQGRWGGMLFVPGGLLVQSDPYKQIQALKRAEQDEITSKVGVDREEAIPSKGTPAKDVSDEVTEKAKRKAERKQRKEEKRLRKEKKRLKKEAKPEKGELGLPTPEISSSSEDKSSEERETKRHGKKPERIPEVEEKPKNEIKTVAAAAALNPRNGRHILRGKNIQAKRMAFSDMKGLDEIFMKIG